MARFFWLKRCYERILNRVENDPAKLDYMDLALTPAGDEDLDKLEIFSTSASAREAADRAHRKVEQKQHVAVA